MVAHKEIVITMSGAELAKGPLPDELNKAVHDVLVRHGYADQEHVWSGPTHKFVYRKMS